MDDFVSYPSFSSENLSIWFVQMESAFTLNAIEDTEKYDHVILKIPSNSLKIVEDIILNPPIEDKYGHFKYQFMKRMLIKKLVEVEFGNETPSEYLRKLKNIAGQRVSDEEIVNVWLNNLPEKVREIVSLGSTSNMDSLGAIADKAVVLVTPSTQSITSTRPQLKEDLSHKEWCEMMKGRMGRLAKQLVKVMGKYENNYELQSSGESEEEDEQPSSSQQKLVKAEKKSFNWKWNTSSPKVMCWYHTKFGNKAIACVAPCQYKFSPTMLNNRK